MKPTDQNRDAAITLLNLIFGLTPEEETPKPQPDKYPVYLIEELLKLLSHDQVKVITVRQAQTIIANAKKRAGVQ